MFQRRITVAICFAVLTSQLVAVEKPSSKGVNKSNAVDFQKDVQPLLAKYCFNCHGATKKKGGLDLRMHAPESLLEKDRTVFEKILQNLTTHEMPPENKPQPNAIERDLLTQWVNGLLFHCDCTKPDPGRVTIRRLNRAEYNDTIRDLVGVDFRPADDFPRDDSGYGFDNIGDVLSMPPVLLEKYFAAAEKILDVAIVTQFHTNGPTRRFEAEDLPSTAQGGRYLNYARGLNREGEVYVSVKLPKDGNYILRARAFGQQAGLEPARMEFLINGKSEKIFDVTAIEDDPAIYEKQIRLTAGEKKFSAAYINNYRNLDAADPKLRGDRNLIIDYLEIIGPSGAQFFPESHRRIFSRTLTPKMDRDKYAREIVGNFAKRAFRRPVTAEEINRLLRLFDSAQRDGENFEASVKLALEAVLVSPYFLFRGELQPEPDNPNSVHPIDEFSLASRLSYFLWSSMPDEELFALAEKKKLRNHLASQVERMLKNPKSHAFMENFSGQWLQLRNLDFAMPDLEQFSDFNDDLRAAMRKETELFLESILREDRSALELIDADYTFLNGQLARLYAIKDVKGESFRRVSLKGSARGGLLTQASILTLTSNPTRTSPVKRGKWVLENILGTPPPPPPPDVPDLKEGKEALHGTLRQRMEQHRANPACASCHARMDPIGFGFENFDAIGRWREKEGDFAIDASGKLVSGESFVGPSQLKNILLKKRRDEFVHCVTEKMLTYALGRGLEFYDQCAIEQIMKNASKRNYKFSTLIAETVQSTPFQMRRGEAAK